jgi:hypothetical protein
MTRFIVLLDKTTEKQDDAFLEYIKSEKMGWWRWFDGSWLIATHNDERNAIEIRDKAREIFPNVNVLVIQLNPDGTDFWAGFGPNTKEQAMFPWLRQTWRGK